MAPALRPLRQKPRESSNRPQRSVGTRVTSYREDSSDPEPAVSVRPRSASSNEEAPNSNDYSHRQGFVSNVPPKKVTRASSGQVKRSLFSQASRSSSSHLNPKNKRRRTKVEEEPVFFSTEVIPPWSNLPYHVLLQIFTYAAPLSVAMPMDDVRRSAKWLLGSARVCKAFFEPVMATLYFDPPVSRLLPAKFAKFVRLLEQDQANLATNYAAKVQWLDFYAGWPNPVLTMIPRIIARVPQIKHLRLCDAVDVTYITRSISAELFHSILQSLDVTGCRLLSFEWNRAFLKPDVEAVHLRPAFRHLRELRLCNTKFEEDDGEEASEDGSRPGVKSTADRYSAALRSLSKLRRLEFVMCQFFGSALLLGLPENLTVLSFERCQGLNSSMVQSFLATHGRDLRELHFIGHRELNLSFTVDLRASCPKLEVFHMDFTVHPISLSLDDLSPTYSQLLSQTETPSWPSSLQVLHLTRMRKWDKPTAERFFNDLIESAPTLVNLRTLIITGILDMEWRERATIRDHWVKKLERVFLRISTPPKTADRYSKALSKADAETTNRRSAAPTTYLSPSKRQSARLAEKEAKREEDESQSQAVDSQPAPLQGTEMRTEEGSSDEFIHGMCTTVEIQIDNLRPAKFIMTVDDFADEEESGDEEWTGDDMELDTFIVG